MSWRRLQLAAGNASTPRGSAIRTVFEVGKSCTRAVDLIDPEGVGGKHEHPIWLVCLGQGPMSGRQFVGQVTGPGTDWVWAGAWLGRPLEALPAGDKLRQWEG